MTSQAEQQILILRDNDNNVYAFTWDAIQSARVPAEKQAELQQALSGQDVAGYIFNFNVAALNQQNAQSANNVVAGLFVGVGAQTALNLASNTANIQQG
jgi:hypothetical protein